jgi:hypothetical protein
MYIYIWIYYPYRPPRSSQDDELLYGIRSWAAQQLQLPTDYVEPLQWLGSGGMIAMKNREYIGNVLQGGAP